MASCNVPFVFLLSVLLSCSETASASLSPSIPPPLPIPPLPSAHQLQWQSREMAFFLHFGTNTFTDSEWGTGHADPRVFFPSRLNTTQWIQVAVDAGFSRVILTAKHHDGFCLWPTQYTNYSVAASPWKNGSGDVVAELANSARAAEIDLGFYLSPWDRHEACYGDTIKYNEFYLGQMTELLTGYDEIKEVWLDGAKGKGEKDMKYFFKSWFGLIRQLQPTATIFSDAGPDSRWVGDEAGAAGSTCWSLFNCSAVTIGGDNDFQYSRNGDPNGIDWVPAECDVSIRPGWFWHSSQHPKSAMTLLDIYYKSVGRNCLLLLNVPPNSSGLISDEDIQALQEFSKMRESIFSKNLAEAAFVTATSTRGGNMNSRFSPVNVVKEGIYTYWAPEEGKFDWEIHLEFSKSEIFNVLMVQEPIQMGQRISEFHFDVLSEEGQWLTVTNGSTVGYKRLLRFIKVETRRVRLVIDKSRSDPLISYLGIYWDAFSAMEGMLDAGISPPNLNSNQTIQMRVYINSFNLSKTT
ncbi:alpha-L-fucosidase 1 [Aristolochia californica]|uniref:alpha-L-fucosidase 1 n=1 Tax=Aristolochia californica TaxID=171875 RepID=UPI0035DD0E41